MTQVKMISIAADLIKEGKTNREIRTALFNLKVARLSQIRKVMDLIE